MDNNYVGFNYVTQMSAFKNVVKDHNYNGSDNSSVTDVTDNKKKRTVWTKEKIETAKRLCENGYKSHDVAIATGMSLSSVKHLLAKVRAGKETVIAKTGPKPKDRTQLINEIKTILTADDSLTLQEISEALPDEVRVSQFIICRILKKMKWKQKKSQNYRRTKHRTSDKLKNNRKKR